MTRKRISTAAMIAAAIAVASTVGLAQPAAAAPPSPALLAEARQDAALRKRLTDVSRLKRARGVDAPRGKVRRAAGKATRRGAGGAASGAAPGPAAQTAQTPSLAPPPGANRALAILVDFSDNTSQVAGTFFDSLIYADVTGPASVRGYYREISNGSIDIVTVNLPSATGWKRMPEKYSYYVDNQYGFGYYPKNAQKMVEDAIDAADVQVDFSLYDNDSDGLVDALFVVHAGQGAEYTGRIRDMWSHQWSVPWTSRNIKDGVRVYTYSTEPEYWGTPGDMTTGVYCHELGHVFGVPDLYDYGNDSRGLGRWSLMAGGSWNGPGGLGGSPARPDAWSLMQLGFVAPTEITANTVTSTIPAVDTAQPSRVFRLWPNGTAGGPEYFLVENRRQRGTDAYSPGQGLAVYHVDETRPNNDDQTRYLVDLEEAHGGTQHLAANSNSGDAGDTFPGSSNKRSFTDSTDPNARVYSGALSYAKVRAVSDDGVTMTAAFSATQYGRLAGSVSDGSGPRSGIRVDIYRWETTSWAVAETTYSAGGGAWSSGDLSPGLGPYRVGFADPAGFLAAEFYDGATSVESADDIAAVEGEVTTGVDAVLALGYGGLGGTVRDGAGTGIQDITVDAWRWSGSSWVWQALVGTRPDGTYDLSGLLAGEYRLRFSDKLNRYLLEYFDDAATLGGADTVAVPSGGSLGGIDATLAGVGKITGFVRDGAGTGIQDITVDAWRWNGSSWVWQRLYGTRPDGSYALGYLPVGTYRIRFADKLGRYLGEYHADAATIGSATDIAISPGTVASGTDATLTGIGRITGRVRNQSANPIPNITIDAWRLEGGSSWVWERTTGTRGDGTYTLGAMPVATYRIRFADKSYGYRAEYYDDAGSLASASDVPVSLGAVVSSIDATLGPGP